MLIMIAALITSREYSRFADRRLAQWQGFSRLISHAEGMIEKYLLSGGALWQDFENHELARIGFLKLLREGASTCEAFSACSSSLSLPRECKDRLFEFFSSFGKGYRERELKSIAAFLKDFNGKYAEEKDRLEKSVRVTRALLLGGALATAVMMI
jgi:hypothetical protein